MIEVELGRVDGMSSQPIVGTQGGVAAALPSSAPQHNKNPKHVFALPLLLLFN
jgi:hypothetical protein